MIHNRIRPLPTQEKVFQKKKLRHPSTMLGLPPGVWKVIDDYCQQSSLHGLKYVSNQNMPYIERYIWLVVFLCSFGYAVHLIYELWEVFDQKPFIVTFDSHMTHIWEVPFPAITICPYLTVKKSALDLNSTDNNTALFYASLVCPLNQALKSRVSELDYIGIEFYDFLKEVSPTCDEVLKRCSFGYIEFDCCERFDPIVTESGLCFIYNSLPLNRILSNNTYSAFPSREHPPHAVFWNPEDGYPQPDTRGKNGSYVYPLWEQVSGERFGLVLELFQNLTEWQQQCTGAYSGFKISVTSPADLPLNTKGDGRVGMDRETCFLLTPQKVNAEYDITPISPDVRGCVFSGERHLQFFNQYTDNNCRTNCLSLEIEQQCGCAPYFLPHLSSTRICSRRKDFACLQRAKKKLTRAEMVRSGKHLSRRNCGCLRGCREISYQSSDFYTDYIYTGGREPPWAGSTRLGPNQVTKVAVYSWSNQFLGKHRTIRYTFLKFAGSCGGLLSLFVGFSVISAIEIVYAFLLRPLSSKVLKYFGQPAVKVTKPPAVVDVRLKGPRADQWQGVAANRLSVTGLYIYNRDSFISGPHYGYYN